MNQFIGVECPACHKQFTAEDDVVVCPECGTPHHRSCWQELGHCANEEKHEEGFSYEMPVEKARLVCPVCGKPAEPGTIFCENCGAPLRGEQAAEQEEAGPIPPNLGMLFTPQEELQGEIDGIPAKDWATFIGPSAGYYLFQFKRMDATGHKISACWSAMLFAPLYFLYRKVWTVGIISGVINLLLNTPSAILYLAEFGGLSTTLSTAWLSKISVPLSAVMLVINLGWGFFGVWLYRKNAAKKIKKIKAEAASDQEYQEVLARKAGPSRIVLICVAVLFLISAIGQLLTL